MQQAEHVNAVLVADAEYDEAAAFAVLLRDVQGANARTEIYAGLAADDVRAGCRYGKFQEGFSL
ncbi:hypothetical protein H9L17_07745 [Thermomonas brevis]|uniref:Uncharacterized protein n=1 Tax=Thermomonas brevis TaxID=215691 RepID=A0A7G9QXC7_9GAMM|nr:hypothetical protein [Thermomonas brevis]QNN48002.1 hypothetical protein H9L17_07745 [Thermomonas brevis]